MHMYTIYPMKNVGGLLTMQYIYIYIYPNKKLLLFQVLTAEPGSVRAAYSHGPVNCCDSTIQPYQDLSNQYKLLALYMFINFV